MARMMTKLRAGHKLFTGGVLVPRSNDFSRYYVVGAQRAVWKAA
jgi:hypothetical protein